MSRSWQRGRVGVRVCALTTALLGGAPEQTPNDGVGERGAVEAAKSETGYIASCAALAQPMAVLPAAAHLQEA